MANAKWIKWATGLAGVMMFTGFVGYLSKGEQADNTSVNTSLAAGSVQEDQSGSGNSQDDLQQQWQSDSQSSDSSDSGSGMSDYGGRHGRFMGGGDTGTGSSSGGVIGQQDQSSGDSSGSFRTRAS